MVLQLNDFPTNVAAFAQQLHFYETVFRTKTSYLKKCLKVMCYSPPISMIFIDKFHILDAFWRNFDPNLVYGKHRCMGALYYNRPIMRYFGTKNLKSEKSVSSSGGSSKIARYSFVAQLFR